MKKIFTLLLTVALIFTVLPMLLVNAEEKPITVTLDGQVVDCEKYGSPAVIVDSRTLVPLRAIFDALGASVDWNGATRTVTSKLGDVEIKLTVGSDTLYKNGKGEKIDVPAMIMNERTMVPARAVAQSVNVDVKWDAGTRTVILTRKTDAGVVLIEKKDDKESIPKTTVYRATVTAEENACGKEAGDVCGIFKGIDFKTNEKDFFINYIGKADVMKKTAVMTISVLPNDTVNEIVFATGAHVAVADVIPVQTLKAGEWSKLTLVYEPDKTLFTLYINEELVSTMVKPVQNNTLRIIFRYATSLGESYMYFDDYAVYSGDVAIPAIKSEKYLVESMKINGFGSDNIGDIKENLLPAKESYTVKFTDKDGNIKKDDDLAKNTDVVTVYDGDVMVGKYNFGTASMSFENAKVCAGTYILPEAKFGKGNVTFSVDYKNFAPDVDAIFKVVQYDKNGKKVASTEENCKISASGTLSATLEIKNTKDIYVLLEATDAKTGNALTEPMRFEAYSTEKIELASRLYQGYTTKAVVFNYDDAVRYDVELVELLNKYGIKCTFNLVGQNIKSNIGSRAPDKSSEEKIFEFVKSVYEGHEISNHSMTHIPACFDEGQIGHNSAGVELVGKSFEELIADTLDCPKYIKEHLGADAVGIAWPQGYAKQRSDYESKILPAITEAGLKYARAAENGTFKLPDDWFQWNATCHHRDAVKYTDLFIGLENSGDIKCFFNWGHSYEFENNKNNPALGWTMIEGVMQKLSAQKDIWKATNGEVYRYAEATKLVEVGEKTVKNNSDMTVYYNINGENVEIKPGKTFTIGK